jgi:hypothetical protein
MNAPALTADNRHLVTGLVALCSVIYSDNLASSSGDKQTVLYL